MDSGNTFSNYPHALYATFVKFQPANRPSGRFAEQKLYFSAKHKLYGFKIDCSVAPPGVAVDVSAHTPGSSSDLIIILDRLHINRQLLRKEEDSVPELGAEPTQFPICGLSWWIKGTKALDGCFGQSSLLPPFQNTGPISQIAIFCRYSGDKGPQKTHQNNQ